ncbi:class I SAM-dependent methyltransferase [uncultured Desulfobacter sp.]|uniref:class I SAM-dependent methyltransferase n=1 Tax=uncultured Desulfobacter sp. TaxID=240139 RepID=UPI0029C7D560|nr:class I SAM-dependent methyltransferase [uncultured Desulfobacter sp.]
MDNNQRQKYWKTIFGIEWFKIDYKIKEFLYKTFGFTFPKLLSQKGYWTKRGKVYMQEIMSSGYIEREIFFQNLLIDFLKRHEFNSFFEAGCGFGWNIDRVQKEFPGKKVGGIDFSLSQLQNSKDYLNRKPIAVVNGDNCKMPYKDDSFDVGFSLGVFMNIHPSKIQSALAEMVRVSKKFIIHIEYDETHTTEALRDKRKFKTNIISHDYNKLYEEMGLEQIDFKTYEDFGPAYYEHQKRIKTTLDRWEGFEGAEKYIFIAFRLPQKSEV